MLFCLSFERSRLGELLGLELLFCEVCGGRSRELSSVEACATTAIGSGLAGWAAILL